MNQLTRHLEAAGFLDPLDTLLADVAIRVQLSATDYGKAESRYHTIRAYLDRDGSLLRGLVSLLYPQGSMAIDATIASCMRTDEFDIDIIVELALALGMSPEAVLDLLYHGTVQTLGDQAALAKARSSLAIRSNRCPSPAPRVPL